MLVVLVVLLGAGPAPAKTLVLDPHFHHLRSRGEREWSDVPARPEGPRLALQFPAERNGAERTLRWRQQDVKQPWKIRLSGQELGSMRADENDMVLYLPVPAGRLQAGENRLVIEQVGRTPDDIRVGEITLDDRSVAQVLSEGLVEVAVVDAGRPGPPAPLPCRITVVNDQGALMTVGATSGDRLAVRPGVV
jgi:hypothetical protein